MANNLRYLLEHFCLDGQKIDVSSQLDEENANNIEKINTQTIPSINARIDDIKNTDIPNINSRIDDIKNTDIPSINQKINTINNTTIPSIQENVNVVNEKADRINESVAKNTRDIGTLSDNVTMQGNTINSINTEKIPSIENNVNELTTKVDTNTGSINELTTKVGANTDNINGLTTKVNANTDSINSLTTKVNTNTDSINTINNTSIPHLQSEIDNLSGGGTGSVGELREKVEKNTSDITDLSGKVDTNTANISTLSGKVDTNTASISTLSGKVDTNTAGISTLSGKVDTNTNIINLLSTNGWSKIKEVNSNGLHIELFRAPNLPFTELHATLSLPQPLQGGQSVTITIPDYANRGPWSVNTAPVHLSGVYPSLNGHLFIYNQGSDLVIGITMSSFELADTAEATLLYRC